MPSSPSLSSKPHFPSSARIEPRLLYQSNQSSRSNSHIRLAKTTVLGLLIVGLGYGFAKVLHDLFTDPSVPFDPGNTPEESYYITSQSVPAAAGDRSNVLLFHHGNEEDKEPSGWVDIRGPDSRDQVAVGKDDGLPSILRGPEIAGGNAKQGTRDPALAKEPPSSQSDHEEAGSYNAASSSKSSNPISQPLSRSSKIDEGAPRGDLWKQQRLTSSAAADIALCGTSPCRVLLPGWIGGDGVQAQQQLVQLGRLTSSLNDVYRRQAGSGPSSPGIPVRSGSLSTTIEDRTFGPYVLVLPNVSNKSRMGSCFKQPFEFYFDPSPEALQELGIERTATYEEFLRWVSAREIRPKVQIVVVERSPRNASVLLPFGSEVQEIWPTTPEQGGSPSEILYDYDFPPDAPKHKYCLHENPRASRLVFHGRRPETTVYPPVIPGGENVMKAAVMEAFGFRRAVNEEGSYITVGHSPDVYVVDWESTLPVFNPSTLSNGVPEPSAGEQGQTQKRLGSPPRSKSSNSKKENVGDNLLPYHPAWPKLADEAASSLSPYLAVHWAIDTVSEAFLPSCTALLIRTLLELLRQQENKDVRTVYLTTGGQSFSDFGVPPQTEGDGNPVQGGKVPALRTLLDAFENGGLLDNYSLTGVKGLLEEVKDDDSVRVLDEIALGEIDSGILALLDRRMAEKAELLMTGTERCGRPSAFGSRIIDNRMKAGYTRNIVETFG
ncbi:hypothetical protein M407DRAFT_3297 [Tulasnella calospora MUT 4182]|uniref:Uncharacterized protein n=1 Tax=Tulasnella calospora MUT 4182 TaxID=1051891 RepID=A0A0C3LKH1_9AGAM|nr:hypothetical protein M407DRAFT_3297 [Tulasnella calospora MUT 4182]